MEDILKYYTGSGYTRKPSKLIQKKKLNWLNAVLKKQKSVSVKSKINNEVRE